MLKRSYIREKKIDPFTPGEVGRRHCRTVTSGLKRRSTYIRGGWEAKLKERYIRGEKGKFSYIRGG